MKQTILLLVFVTSFLYSQQYYNWKTVQTPGQIGLGCIVSEDEIILRVEQQGYLSSTDGGENWIQCEGDLPLFTLSSFAVGERIFIVGHNGNLEFGLYYTDDLGTTVNQAVLPETYQAIEVLSSGSALYTWYAENKQIYRSTDNGVNWYAYKHAPDMYSFDVTSDDNLYYSGLTGTYKLLKAGMQWEKISDEIFSPFIASNDVIVGENVNEIIGIMYSTDGGGTWEQLGCANPVWELYKDASGQIYGTIQGGLGCSLFRIDLINQELDQVLSKANMLSYQIQFIENQIAYMEWDKIHFQMEEIFPQFETGFYPLNLNNRWLYYSQTHEFALNQSQKELSELSIVKDSLIDGQQYYLQSDGKLVRYTDEENTIKEYWGNESFELVSYNYGQWYMYPVFEEEGSYRYETIDEITGTGAFEGLIGRNIYQAEPYSEYQGSRSYLQNVGVWKESGLSGGTLSTQKDLLQAVIYNESGDSTLYDELTDPIFEGSVSAAWDEQNLNISCTISHELNSYKIYPSGYLSSVNLIDKATLEYKYYHNSIWSEVEVIELDSMSMFESNVRYSANIVVDTNMLSGESDYLSVRVTADTRGISKHSVQSEWFDIEYGVTSIEDGVSEYNYSLSAGYPNPFNPSTKMEFTLPKESDVMISVYNVTGEELFTVAAGNYKAGRHEVNINMSDYSSGVYFVRMLTGEKVFTNKIMLLK